MGRPVRAFEPETADKIVTAIVSDGIPWRVAAGLHGVHEQIVSRWIMENSGFACALKKAQASHVRGMLSDLRDAGAGQWQKHAWLLERQYPDQFGQNQRLQVESVNKVEISAAVCAQIADGWMKFKEKTIDI